MENLVPLYRSTLQACSPTTPEQRRDVFKLRYQVYCLERGFEPPAQFSDRIETDDFDDRAVHFMTRHRPTQNVLGVTRLVLDAPRGDLPLPVETHDLPVAREILARLRKSGKVKLAEVSRLAVTRDLSTLCESPAVAVDSQVVRPISPEMSRILPQHVSIGLLALLFRESWELGVTHWVALLDSALMRCYARIGIQCQPIGPAIEHRGRRQPIVANLTEVWGEIQRRCPPMARLIQDFARDSDFEEAFVAKRQAQYGRTAALLDQPFIAEVQRATA